MGRIVILIVVLLCVLFLVCVCDFDLGLRRDHWLPFLGVLWVPMLFALCYTKALRSAGRSLLLAATFLSPFEKFLRNTRKVPATGATPSHWPCRNRPIEPAYNHTANKQHSSLTATFLYRTSIHSPTHTHWHSLNTTDKTSNTHTIITAQIHGGVL